MIEIGKDYGGRAYTPIPVPVSNGVSEVLYCPYCRDMVLHIATYNIGTVGSFTFTVEGSLTGDSNDFGNLSATNSTTTVSSNKTTIITYDGAMPPYVRVSISSSTFLSSSASYLIYATFGVMS
ncbi:unnamed protein product [marine sediment metagenome]|uniref:Uncharacterized protein n=1 Tax=marine sediment metagenome TaxID=412755 RepID=X0TPY3_9ZZZZ